MRLNVLNWPANECVLTKFIINMHVCAFKLVQRGPMRGWGERELESIERQEGGRERRGQYAAGSLFCLSLPYGSLQPAAKLLQMCSGPGCTAAAQYWAPLHHSWAFPVCSPPIKTQLSLCQHGGMGSSPPNVVDWGMLNIEIGSCSVSMRWEEVRSDIMQTVSVLKQQQIVDSLHHRYKKNSVTGCQSKY